MSYQPQEGDRRLSISLLETFGVSPVRAEIITDISTAKAEGDEVREQELLGTLEALPSLTVAIGNMLSKKFGY